MLLISIFINLNGASQMIAKALLHTPSRLSLRRKNMDQFFQIASMIPGFLVVIPFLPLMAAVHYSSPPERKSLSMLGIVFAGISVAMLSITAQG